MLSGRYVTWVAAGSLGMWSALAAAEVRLDFGDDTDDAVQSLRMGGDIVTTVKLDNDACGMLSLTADGAPRASFGQDGRLLLGPCPGDVRIRSDGAIVSTERGGAENTSGWRLRVRSADGAQLLSSPVVYLPNSSRRERRPELLALRTDGSFLVGGAAFECRFCGSAFVDRFLVDGTLDPAFGGGVIVGDFDWNLAMRSMFALPNGKILLSGKIVLDAASAVAMRLNADGTPDVTFGANGRVSLTSGGPALSSIDTAGRLYLVTGQGGLARILTDGSLDSSYAGGNAQAFLTISSISIDTLDRVVLFGDRAGAPYVARFTDAGNPDSTFNGTGETLVTFSRPLDTHSTPRCVGAVQSGNRPVIACTVQAESDADVAPRDDVAIVRLTSAGVPDATFGAGQPAPDSYPDAFSFANVTAPYGTAWVESAPQTIVGFTDPSRIEISGGQHSIGCNGSFTAEPGVITAGQTVCVRRSASMQPGVSSVAEVRIGGRRATFTVISGNSPADFVPDTFSFVAQSEVELGVPVISNAVTITGITGAAAVTVTNGSFSIGCTGNFRTLSTVITNGESICVTHEASTSLGTTTSTQLTVGGVTATFSSTTIAADIVPNAFAFTDQTAVASGTTVTSNAVIVTGINTAASISVAAGEYSIGCNGSFTSAAGSIESGQSVCVRHTAAAAANATVTTTVTIGGVSDNFTSTTAAASESVRDGGTSGSSGGGAMDRWWVALLGILAWMAPRRRRAAHVLSA